MTYVITTTPVEYCQEQSKPPMTYVITTTPMGILSGMISNTYLDNLLHRDDVSSMPQADRLLWGESLEALLHHLQTEHVISIIIQLYELHLPL